MSSTQSFPVSTRSAPSLNNQKISNINSFFINGENSNEKMGHPSEEKLISVSKFCLLKNGRKTCFTTVNPQEPEKRKGDFLCTNVDPRKAKCFMNIEEKEPEQNKLCGLRAISTGATESVCLN